MNHVRIDEGVKRGPRRKGAPARPNKRSYTLEGSKSVPAENRELIIAKVASGTLMRDVAAELGVSAAVISQYLASDPEYQKAKESGIEQQLEYWQSMIETADSPLNLARAREAFRAASWRGEREHPRRWGQKQEIAHTVSPVLHIHVADVPQNAVQQAHSTPLLSNHPSQVIDS